MSNKKNQVMVAAMASLITVGIVVEYLRRILPGIKAAELATAGSSVAGSLKAMQVFANGLRVGDFEIPAVAAVAILGIVMNLILNWEAIVEEARNPVAGVGEHALGAEAAATAESGA